MTRAAIDPRTASVLAHVADPAPAPDHSAFWKSWYARLTAHDPVLRARTTPDPSDPGATHEYDSGRTVRIGCALLAPRSAPVRAGLVVLHGAEHPGPLGNEPRRWRRMAERGVLVLVPRLRGYPGSRSDPLAHPIGWTTEDPAWIARGLLGDEHDEWILPDLVGDACDAVRALRGELARRGAPTDVFVHGRSLGAGLGVIAAAQLNGRESGPPPVARLSMGCPSLGALRWRLEHAPVGQMAPIHDALLREPDRRAALLDRVRLCDAAIHARRVRVPTLAMLAAHDEVVAPRAAAALFNAINADPGRKWRVLVDEGHARKGYGVKRADAAYRRIERDFLDPSRAPIDAMRTWEPALLAPLG